MRSGERRDAAEHAPGVYRAPAGAVWAGEDEMPRMALTRQRAILFGLFVLSAVAFLYFVLPNIAGFGRTVHRIEGGDRWWLGIGVCFELLSFAGYVVLFRAVFVDGQGPIGWRESYQITMAGLAATRLFAFAGAGGVALTAWALRRSGMAARVVATRMLAFLVLLYSIYAGSLLLAGVGLGTGLLPGGGSFAITIVPAIVAGVLLAVAAAVAMLPEDVERRLLRSAASQSGGDPRSARGRLGRLANRLASAPALAGAGVRTALTLGRARHWGLIGAPAWWGFDICVLWAGFHAFGSAPDFTVIWMAYFVGMFGNLLPLPGGLGGVEGGMIGAFAALGVDVPLAVVAVLAYRAISFWLPTLPGAIAYFQLRRTVARWRERPVGARHADQHAAVEQAGPLPTR